MTQNASLYDNGLKQRFAGDTTISQELSAQRRQIVQETVLPEVLALLHDEGIDAKLEIVGSTATGSATNESDVDLTASIKTPGKDSDVTYARIRSLLYQAQQNHNLPFSFHVHQPGENAELRMKMQVAMRDLHNSGRK